MKTSIFMLAMLAVAAMAQTPEEKADLALAAARLAEAAQPAPAPTYWRYVTNPDMDVDAVELDPEEQVQPGDFLQRRPLERPPGVPENFVPVRVFQWQQDGWRFLGWMLLSLDDVQELHENLETT